jgi:hypothetical protein
MNTQEERKEMYNFAMLLKEKGFQVSTMIFNSDRDGITKENIHEIKECGGIHFSKDGKLWGYVWQDNFGFNRWSIDYKPSREMGSGYQILEHGKLTVENAEHTLQAGLQYALKQGLYNPNKNPIYKDDAFEL